MNKKILFGIVFLILLISTFSTLKNIRHIEEIKKIDAYKSALNKVPSNDLNNIVKTEDILLSYLPTTNNQIFRDKAFESYRIKFYKVLRHTSAVYKGKVIDDCNYAPDNDKDLPIIEKYFKQKGLRLMWMEGCYYVEEDNIFTIQKFSKFLSPPWKEYLELRAKEDNRFINDGYLAMPFDELSQRIIFWENFINKYPSFPENNEIKAKLGDYIEWYIIESTSAYGNGGPIDPDLRKSYEKFLKNNKNSKFYPIVESWYNLLKKNKFIYTYYFDGEKEIVNDVAYKKFKIKQPYKVFKYNKDIYNGLSP